MQKIKKKSEVQLKIENTNMVKKQLPIECKHNKYRKKYKKKMSKLCRL